jgi:hypothetical protein
MAHIPILMDRAAKLEGDFFGHAMMASCPPNWAVPVTAAGDLGRRWNVANVSLANLMDLSSRLGLEGEVTPVRAFGMVLAHPKAAAFEAPDLAALTEELGRKVKCYG